MLAFVMLWAYFSFSQYLIIYSGNLPEEITWYMRRLHHRLARRSASPWSSPISRVPFLLLLVAGGQAEPAAAGQGRDRHHRRAADRSVLADRAGASTATASRQLDRRRAAAVAAARLARLLHLRSCAAGRFCRCTIRSSTRRSARSSRRPRSARYERRTRATSSRSTSRRSTTKRPTSTSAPSSGLRAG